MTKIKTKLCCDILHEDAESAHVKISVGIKVIHLQPCQLPSLRLWLTFLTQEPPYSFMLSGLLETSLLSLISFLLWLLHSLDTTTGCHVKPECVISMLSLKCLSLACNVSSH